MEAETPGAPAQAEDAQALHAKVQETLEALLSKKNLVSDQFLAGNMNPQMYIPIRVLIAHEKMSAIGATEETVSAAASTSTRLGIDDAKTMVRPLLKSKRNVIILRDMPDNTTEEDVKAIFKSAPHAEKLVSVKAEVNNAWFVKFKLDEGTQDVVLWLRSQKFQDRPLNASIKSEHFLRSFFPIQPGNPPPDAGMGFPMDGGMGGMGFPMGYPPQDMMMMGCGKGDGKGMMPMMSMPMQEMPPMMGPNGPQPPGSWQPWGKRHQPPPMILPIKVPDMAPKTSDTWGADGGGQQKEGKGKGEKGKGKGGEEKWGGDSWGAQKWGDDNWGSGSKWGNEKWGNEKWGENKSKPSWHAKKQGS